MRIFGPSLHLHPQFLGRNGLADPPQRQELLQRTLSKVLFSICFLYLGETVGEMSHTLPGNVPRRDSLLHSWQVSVPGADRV